MQTIPGQKAFFEENENKLVNISVQKKSGEIQEYVLPWKCDLRVVCKANDFSKANTWRQFLINMCLI